MIELVGTLILPTAIIIIKKRISSTKSFQKQIDSLYHKT